MTKEELLGEIWNAHMSADSIREKMKNAIHKFYESNIVMAKGVVRHKYADDLHFLAENADAPHECSADIIRPMGVEHIRITFNKKPKEPVYEWQWVVFNNHDNSFRDMLNYSKPMTEEEAYKHYKEKLDTKIYSIYRLDPTMKERK